MAFNTNDFSFSEGKQQLTGEQALAFVRERKAFSDGDTSASRTSRSS